MDLIWTKEGNILWSREHYHNEETRRNKRTYRIRKPRFVQGDFELLEIDRRHYMLRRGYMPLQRLAKDLAVALERYYWGI